MRNVVAVGVLVLVASVAALTSMAAYDKDHEEIKLVVRNMAFYLEGSDEPNPLIVVKPGQQFRIILENQDAGIQHDFQIPTLSVALGGLTPGSEVETPLLRAPETPGRYPYFCSPHAAMMHGILEVLPQGSPAR